jgi:hypothetical protein
MTSIVKYGLRTPHRAFYNNSPYSIPRLNRGHVHLCRVQGEVAQNGSCGYF